jgi:glutathione S-transferase
MRLYHHPMSTNARRAVMTALELGLSVELVLIDLGKGAQRAPGFRKLNPNGKVPVLDDDGFVLWESHAIMAYLADKTPGQTLYPADVRARADVNRWLFWNSHHFAPAVAILGWERVVKPMIGQGPANPARVAEGEALVGALGAVLDAHLAGKLFVAQDRLTLADIALATPLASLDRAKLPVADRPNLLAWLGRMKERDAWKRTEAAV